MIELGNKLRTNQIRKILWGNFPAVWGDFKISLDKIGFLEGLRRGFILGKMRQEIRTRNFAILRVLKVWDGKAWWENCAIVTPILFVKSKIVFKKIPFPATDSRLVTNSIGCGRGENKSFALCSENFGDRPKKTPYRGDSFFTVVFAIP